MDIRIPRLAEGVEAGTVVTILVSEGQAVKKDQTLVEIETKKAVAPVPSPADGTVARIHVKEGQEVAVGQVIVSLAKGPAAGHARPASVENGPSAGPAQPRESDGASSAAPAGARVRTQAEPVSQTAPSGAEPFHYQSPSGFPPPAAPSIRKMAQDLGIDLTRVRGSEPGGRIVLADLRAYIAQLQRAAEPSAPRAAEPAGPAPVKIDFAKWGPVTRKTLTPIRRTIAQEMHASWTNIPHVTQFADAEISGLMDLRKAHARAYEKKGARLTLTSFLLKAIVDVLKKHPIFNASYDEASQEIVFKSYYHLGIAVHTEHGLMVPVVRDADKKSLLQLSQEVQDMAQKARDRKIALSELEGGTFTLSNQGGIGGTHFTPIIHRPELAILGAGQGAPAPVVQGKKMAVGLKLPLALSYDHRLIDGGEAAAFIRDLVHGVENFKEEDVKL